MRWLTFAIAAFVLLALDVGVRNLLALPVDFPGPLAGRTPSLLLVLGAFIALWGPVLRVYAALVILGLLMEMTTVSYTLASPLQHEYIPAVGPFTLGLLAGGWVLVQFRRILFREAMLTLAMMTLLMGLVRLLVGVALYMLRGLPIIGGLPDHWSLTDALLGGMAEVVYSALLALPLGWVLIQSRTLWGFGQAPAAFDE